jgi:hypothetical protein
MGVGPEREQCHLTAGERIVWREITSTPSARDADRQMAKIVQQHHGIEIVWDADYVWVEVPFDPRMAEEFYAAWWAWAAGNEEAWKELEEGFSQVIDSLGLELYGEREGDDPDGDED